MWHTFAAMCHFFQTHHILLNKVTHFLSLFVAQFLHTFSPSYIIWFILFILYDSYYSYYMIHIIHIILIILYDSYYLHYMIHIIQHPSYTPINTSSLLHLVMTLNTSIRFLPHQLSMQFIFKIILFQVKYIFYASILYMFFLLLYFQGSFVFILSRFIQARFI
jgi:hypothetical protein